MVRSKRNTETNTVQVQADPTPVVDEKEAILVWLRSVKVASLERNTRWIADRIEAGDHLQ